MTRVLSLLAGALALAAVASAQTAGSGASAAPTKAYVEGVAQSAFGNVTSQSYGGEFGFRVLPSVQVFVEAGQIRNVAPPAFGTGAQAIANSLSETQPNVGFSAKEPVTFGVAGVKFLIPVGGKAEPYVMGGFGVAKVKQDVTFTVGGTDITSNIQQAPYRVVLGTDLSGEFTKPMLVLGSGVAWPAWQHLIVDFQFRYGRIFAEDEGINVGRVGLGLGIRF